MVNDKNHYLKILKRFATGVTIITTRDHNEKDIGVTISSFTSVSLIPPKILFCLSRNSNSLLVFRKSPYFAINFLNSSQSQVSEAFAKQNSLTWSSFKTIRDSSTGCLLLIDALGHLICKPSAFYEEGDHVIVLAYVIHINLGSNCLPLVRYNGEYQTTTLIIN